MVNEKFIYIAVFVIVLLIITANLVIVSVVLSKINRTQQTDNLAKRDLIPLTCPVLVLGAGFGGSYAAYHLAPEYKNSLCIVERENRVGGKGHDLNYQGETVPISDGHIIPLGSIRYYKSQPVMVQLANELNITASTYAYQSNLIKTRGRFYTQYNDMCSAYVNLTCTNDEQGFNAADRLWVAMINKYRASPDSLSHFADLAAYARSLLGDEATEYLRDSFRFRSDFQDTHPKAYMEFLSQEFDVGGDILYPHGGMSQFSKRMIFNATTKFNARLYLTEEVLRVEDYSENDDTSFVFSVETTRYKIRAKQIISAIDPYGWQNIVGSVAQDIKSSPYFQAILPIKMITIHNYWPRRWWEETQLVSPLGSLDRAWTRQNCINFIEVLSVQRPDGHGQNLTRSVYDDSACVGVWEEYILRSSSDDLIEEIRRGLQSLFPDVNIPRPLRTFPKVWPSAWHFQRPNSTVTNQDITKWALNPLPRFNRQALTMVGEAYYLNRATWADGAAKSVLRALASQFKMNFPCFENDAAEGSFCANN